MGSATVGTGLLAGAFVLMARAEASTWAKLAWGIVALMAVAAFLARFRADRVQEALGLAVPVALWQTVALHAVVMVPGRGATGVVRALDQGQASVVPS